MNAFSGVFPAADVSGCFFHFSSNIWKRIQPIGLQERYNNDAEFALHLRMIAAAVAFVPPNDVVDVFEELSDVIRNTIVIVTMEIHITQMLMEYWITLKIRTSVDIDDMPHVDLQRTHLEMPRTNNHIEGWHRRFQSLCADGILPFGSLLTC